MENRLSNLVGHYQVLGARYEQILPEADTSHAEDGEGVSSNSAVKCFSLWLMDALELPALGMPTSSYTLTFDAGPAPHLASEIFKTHVQRTVIYQKAIIDGAKRHSKPTDELSEMLIPGCKGLPAVTHHEPTTNPRRLDIYPGFAEAAQSLIDGSCPIVNCTFDTGPRDRDGEDEIERLESLSFVQIGMQWQKTNVSVEMPSGLPSWMDLLAEKVMPEYFEETEIPQITTFDSDESDGEDNDVLDAETGALRNSLCLLLLV